MDKAYNPATTEEKWLRFWEEHNFFKADPNSSKKPYGLLMPPPNVTGALHLGHAMQHSIMDAVARFKRMQGYEVLLLPGVDHAGIQFEGTLNKALEKEGLSKQKLGREEWLKRAWKFKEESYNSVSSTWRVMGLSADWSREVFTLDPQVEKAVFQEFKAFWDTDLLYKGAYIVQWCSKDQTAIEDLEMEYEERKEKLYYVKYELEGTKSIDEYIVVATARPETIFADSGIAIYPNHQKFGKYDKMHAINPLNGRSLPIFPDKRVDKNFGTGALKITPGHDPLDFEIGKDNNLPVRHVVDKTGRMTDTAVFDDKREASLEGLKVGEARQRVVEYLEKNGHLEGEPKDYIHSVPVCERCKTTIEPLISDEWFVSMRPLSEKALNNIGKINFVPSNYGKILTEWIKNVHDWCISRPLWWGYRIPVWYCQKCNTDHLVGKDKDMVVSLHEPEKSCQTCGEKNWEQDEKLLDTWFSSGLWPMATLGWPDSAKEFKKYFPWSFEISAPEIKFLWISRMIMLSLWFTDKIPFENMFFHGMIRDLQGRKFSKSLGNGIDPNELRLQWGTDATRMALYTYSAPGRDGRASRQTMDERAKNFRNFATKIYNIAKFVIDLKPDTYSKTKIALGDKSGHTDDEWILDELNKTIHKVTGYIDNFELHLASEEIYNFVWHTFADIYIEKSKSRREQAQPTLELVLKTSLELLHPFMPFITEEIWQKLDHEEKSISITSWPQRFTTAGS